MGNTATGRQLRPESISDLLDNTSFSEKEIRKWYHDFVKDFPSGSMGIDQFKDVYVQHFPNGDATKFAEHVFRTFDQDDNHQMDFREFMTSLSVTARGSPEERLRWAFEMYDIDESGYISKAECTEIIKAIQALRGGDHPSNPQEVDAASRAQAVFARCDVDHDGALTEDELVEGLSGESDMYILLQRDQHRY